MYVYITYIRIARKKRRNKKKDDDVSIRVTLLFYRAIYLLLNKKRKLEMHLMNGKERR